MTFHEPSQVPRILIIDDNLTIHEDYKKILVKGQPSDSQLDELEAALFGESQQVFSSPGYMVDFASQGKEALAMVERAGQEGSPYALAFVDGRMPPGWDGVETIERLWRVSPELQTVLCTAYADYSWGEIQQKLGKTDSLVILKKPFDIAEVLQLAHALTRKWELSREIQGRLHQLAYFDSLTGLPNRTQFLDSLNKVLSVAREQQQKAAILYIDLDDFKRINDTLGHSAGDKLLKIVAQRLSACIRNMDLLGEMCENHNTARLGGDEFTVLLPDLETKEEAAAVARRISDSLTQPIGLGDHQVMVVPSIGIAMFPEDGRDADTLRKNADMAMYYAKRNGPKNYRFFQGSMKANALKRLAIETQLRHGVQREEFSLVYQPQFNLKTGSVSGLEALLRWENDKLGQVSPLEFIPIAEESGLIHDLGEWVMRTACKQAKKWRDLGTDLPRIAVNVSPKEFIHPNFLAKVKSTLADSGLDPTVLQIEITENLLMEHYEGAATVLEGLNEMGVQVSIDDFGKGYSSLDRLQALSIDCLKIDRSFVGGIDLGCKEQSVLNAIIAMAKGMSLEVIAEGVETRSQFEYLQYKKCDEAQGYLLSMPLTSEQTEIFLESTTTPTAFSEVTVLKNRD